MRAKEGVLVRPLLLFHRAELEAWAQARDLWWWDDPANRNPRHLRSWLRSVLLPVVREKIPDVDQRLLDVGVQATVDRSAWDSVLSMLPGLEFRPEPFGASIQASVISSLERNLAASVIMALVRRAGGVVGLRHAERAAQFARESRSGSRLELPGGWVLERGFDRLLICRPRELVTPTIELPVGAEGSLDWGDWRLVWRREPAPVRQSRDALTAWFIPETLSVRSWRAGDRMVPIGARGHRLAVRCFQDRKVPRLSRAGWPVFDHGGTVLWIPGVCRSAEQVPAPGVPAVRVDVAPR
jgi:tRNA(Ile)-lysidine synthase